MVRTRGGMAGPSSSRPSRSPRVDERSIGDIRTSLTEGEIRRIQGYFGIPADLELHLPGPEERANRAPPGSLAVYADFFRAGLRFPLHPFIIRILELFRVAPAQLAPNSFRLLHGFMVVCHLTNIELRTSLFTALFFLRGHSSSPDWWCFVPRRGRGFLTGLPSSIHGWKERFFFISSPHPWGFSPVWGEPRLSPNQDGNILDRDELGFNRITNAEIPSLAALLSEDNLFDAEISLRPRLDMRPTEEELRGMGRRAVRKRPTAVATTARSVRPRTDGETVPRAPGGGDDIPAPAPVSSGPGQSSGPSPAEAANPGEVIAAVPLRQRTGDVEGGSEPAPRPPSSGVGAGPSSSRAAPPENSSIRPDGFSSEDSGLQDPELAYRLLRGVLLPRDRAAFESQPAEEVALGLWPAILQICHRASVLSESYSKLSDLSRSWKDRVDEATAQREVADEILRVAERKAEENRAMAEENQAQSRRLAQELKLEKEKSAAKDTKLRKKKRKSKAQKSSLAGAQNSLAGAVKELANTRAMLAEAKESARLAESALQAFTEKEKAEARDDSALCALAVEHYKLSGDFREEVLEGCIDAFEGGFNACRDIVARQFPGLDLSQVKIPDEEEEEGPAEAPEEGELPAKTGTPAAETPIAGLPAEIPVETAAEQAGGDETRPGEGSATEPIELSPASIE